MPKSQEQQSAQTEGNQTNPNEPQAEAGHKHAECEQTCNKQHACDGQKKEQTPKEANNGQQEQDSQQ